MTIRQMVIIDVIEEYHRYSNMENGFRNYPTQEGKIVACIVGLRSLLSYRKSLFPGNQIPEAEDKLCEKKLNYLHNLSLTAKRRLLNEIMRQLS